MENNIDDGINKQVLTAREIFNNVYPYIDEKYVLWLKNLNYCPYNLDGNKKEDYMSIDNIHHDLEITPNNNISMFLDTDYYRPYMSMEVIMKKDCNNDYDYDSDSELIYETIEFNNPFRYKNKLISLGYNNTCRISTFDDIYAENYCTQIIICKNEITIEDIEDAKKNMIFNNDNHEIQNAPLTPIPEKKFNCIKFTKNGIEYNFINEY